MWFFFSETTSGFLSIFSASWFDSEYMFLPVYGGLCTRILRSILVLLFVTVFSATLGLQWYMLFVSLRIS